MTTGVVSKNHALGAFILGMLELLFAAGIAMCSFAMASVFDASVSLTPYWAGLPYLVPGILGIVVGLTKNYCAMVAFMVVNIVCFVVDCIACIVILLVVSVWASMARELGEESSSCRYHEAIRTCICSGSTTWVTGVENCKSINTIVALIYTIVVFAVINCAISLAASIVGCGATCCAQRQPGAVIVQRPSVYGHRLSGYTNQGVPGYNPHQPPPPAYDMDVRKGPTI